MRRIDLVGLLLLLAGCAPTGGGSDDIGTAVYVGDAMVRGYKPTSTLVGPAHPVDAARHRAVDIHCHWSIDDDPHAMLQAMDDRNVRSAVNLSGGWGEQLDSLLSQHHAIAPDRLLIFCNVDFSRAAEPDFGPTMVAFLEDARRRGVSGLKVFKSLGLTTRDANGALIAVDDPRLDPIWAACGRLGMPVLIHTADPVAFFSAPDECNERWMQLQRHPSWSFHGPAFPSRDELFAQRDRMITRHPGTTFICAHVGSHADDLAAADRFLTAHPNAYVDISGRVGALGRQPFTARAFLIEHQDRVIYGTDRFPGRPDQPRYRIYFRFLETADEYFDYYDHPFPPAGDWRIYGVDLPDDVLRKIYYGNSDRILPRAGG